MSKKIDTTGKVKSNKSNKEHQEVWDFVLQFKNSEEETEQIYNTLVKEGFYNLEKLQCITSEDDLMKIGIKQFEKRRNIYSTLKRNKKSETISLNQVFIETAKTVPNSFSIGCTENDVKETETLVELFAEDEIIQKDEETVIEKIKKIGTRLGRGAISRLFYALSLVKKRMLEIGLEGSIEAQLSLAMFSYCIEVEINNAKNTVEQEVQYLKEIESTDAQRMEKEQNDCIKNKEAKFSFIKKAIAKFLVAFRNHMMLMAEKMNKNNLAGNISIGFNLAWGNIGSISLKPKIDINALVEWNNKQMNLVKLRQYGNLMVHLMSGRDLKKNNLYCVFQIGEEKRQSTFKSNNNPNWDETFDALPCALSGEELSIQLYHKNKNIGKNFIEEVFINIEKLKFSNNIPKLLDIPLVSNGLLKICLTYQNVDPNVFDGILKVEVLEGKKLAKKDFSGKSDPYLIFFPGKIRANKINTKSKSLIKTKYIAQNLNPVWNEKLTLKLISVKEGFTIFCYDYDLTGDHDFMGKVFVPLDDVKPNKVYDVTLDLIPEGKIRIKYQYCPKK